MADAKNDRKPIDAEAVDKKLVELGIEGETAKERLIQFKKKYWADDTLGKDYLQSLLKSQPGNEGLKALLEKVSESTPPVISSDILRGQEVSDLFAAIQARSKGKKFESLEEAIIADKKEYWIDDTLTPPVVAKIDQVEKMRVGKGLAGEVAKDLAASAKNIKAAPEFTGGEQSGVTLELPNTLKGTGYNEENPAKQAEAIELREKMQAVHIVLARKAGIQLIPRGIMLKENGDMFHYTSQNPELTAEEARKKIGKAAAQVQKMTPDEMKKFMGEVEAVHEDVKGTMERIRREAQEEMEREKTQERSRDGNVSMIQYDGDRGPEGKSPLGHMRQQHRSIT